MPTSTEPLRIRRAGVGDAVDLQRNCFGMDSLDVTMEALEADLAAMVAGTHVRLVAELDGTVVGNATLIRDPHILKQHIGSVHDVVVCGLFQGRGIARRLFEQIDAEAVAMGLQMLEISVRAGTAAEQVYRKLGFREYGRLPGGVLEP